MKLKALVILTLVSTSAFAESALSEARSLKLIRAMPSAQVQTVNAPVVIDPSGRGRVIWRVIFPAEVSTQDSCLANAAYFQSSAESIVMLQPGQGIPTPTIQSLAVRSFEVRGVSLQAPSLGCSQMPVPMRRMVQLSLTFSKEDQLLRLTPPNQPSQASALFQYVSVAGQLFQVRLMPAMIGSTASVQMLPLGPPPAL